MTIASLLRALWEEGERLPVLLIFNLLVVMTGEDYSSRDRDLANLMFVLLVSILQQSPTAKKILIPTEY